MADDLDNFIAGAAYALRLEIQPEWKPAIRANLEATLRHAALVDEFPLPDDAEQAPIYGAGT